VIGAAEVTTSASAASSAASSTSTPSSGLPLFTSGADGKAVEGIMLVMMSLTALIAAF
jgi:hypothetical protein